MSGWATLSLSRHISSILTSSFLSISASSFSSSSGVNDFPSVHSVWSRIPSTIGFFFFVFVLIVFQSHWLFPLLFSQVEDLEELVASPLFRLLTPTWRQSEPPQFGSCCNSSSSNALTVGSGSTLKRSLQCSGSHAWREFYGRCLIHGRLSGAACWFSTPLWGIPIKEIIWGFNGAAPSSGKNKQEPKEKDQSSKYQELLLLYSSWTNPFVLPSTHPSTSNNHTHKTNRTNNRRMRCRYHLRDGRKGKLPKFLLVLQLWFCLNTNFLDMWQRADPSMKSSFESGSSSRPSQKQICTYILSSSSSSNCRKKESQPCHYCN